MLVWRRVLKVLNGLFATVNWQTLEIYGNLPSWIKILHLHWWIFQVAAHQCERTPATCSLVRAFLQLKRDLPMLDCKIPRAQRRNPSVSHPEWEPAEMVGSETARVGVALAFFFQQTCFDWFIRCDPSIHSFLPSFIHSLTHHSFIPFHFIPVHSIPFHFIPFIPFHFMSFIPSFLPSFLHSFIHSFLCSFVRSVSYRLFRSFLCSFVPSLLHSLISCPFIVLYICYSSPSRSIPLVHPFISSKHPIFYYKQIPCMYVLGYKTACVILHVHITATASSASSVHLPNSSRNVLWFKFPKLHL